jgi:membrane protein DedA with SNARE-associated domain
VESTLARVERNQAKFVLAMRFLWGLRIALPVALGLTTMPALRYLWLNLISAAVWATTVTLVGFTAGRLVMRLIEDLHHYERVIVVVVVTIGVSTIAFRWRSKTNT